jgi:hypothetical protein
MSGVAQESDANWRLTAVKIAAVGVPDNTKTWFIKLKDKTVAPLVELTDDGIIRSINVPFSGRTTATEPAETPVSKETKIDPRRFLTQEILMCGSTAKMAELVAKEIYSIRESRNELFRGQADNMPKDGEQLKLMLDNLSIQENALTAMFTGTRETSAKTVTFRIPIENEFADRVAFRFSKIFGILEADNFAGEPYYLTLKDLHTVAIPPDDGKKKKTEGIAYNLPGKASVTLTDGIETIVDGEMMVTQFGTVEYLAPTLFSKNTTFSVVFDPVTGGILKIDQK